MHKVYEYATCRHRVDFGLRKSLGAGEVKLRDVEVRMLLGRLYANKSTLCLKAKIGSPPSFLALAPAPAQQLYTSMCQKDQLADRLQSLLEGYEVFFPYFCMHSYGCRQEKIGGGLLIWAPCFLAFHFLLLCFLMFFTYRESVHPLVRPAQCIHDVTPVGSCRGAAQHCESMVLREQEDHLDLSKALFQRRS